MPINLRERFHQLGPFRPLLALIDLLTAVAASLLAAIITSAVRPEIIIWPMPEHYLAPTLIGAVLLPGTLNWFGVYRSWRGASLDAELRPVVLATLFAFALLAIIALATKTTTYFSRTWMASWAVLCVSGICVSRILIRGLLATLHARGFDTATVALIGDGVLAERVARHLQANPEVGLKTVGYFSVDNPAGSQMPLPRLGTIDTLRETLEQRGSGIDQLWITLPLAAEEPIRRILHDLRHSTVDIRMIPDMFSYHLLNYSSENVVGLPVLNLSYSPLSGANRYSKELLDRMLALLILLGISPLLLLIAAAIKISSPGPVIFRQTRHGGDGKPFTVFKFRTMHDRRDADRDATEQARRNDPRVTALGQFLRRTSLDELPQFFNVLQGTMSIVGPRPHPVELNDLFCDQVERYMWRHKVKPGITGWAQVNGLRGETDTIDKMRKRVEYDLYYIDHWSLWFDIKIIAITVLRGFTDRNAY